MKKILIIFIFCGLFGVNSLYANSLQQHVYGLSGDLLKKIQTQLDANTSNTTTDSDLEVKSIQEQSTADIKQMLSSAGYFKPDVQTKLVKNNNTWIASYYITKGTPVIINQLDIQITGEAQQDEHFQKLLRHFPIQKGDVLLASQYQEAKSELVNLGAQRGYFAGYLQENKIYLDLEHNTAKVVLHYFSGPRYVLGPVIFSKSPYSDRFLQRFVPYKLSDPYNNNRIVNLQENLSNSNLFQQVLITPKPDPASLTVPMYVDITPRKAIQYNLGAGYGTDTGVRGLLGVQLRRINSCGHHLESILQASQKEDHFETNYYIPGKNPVTDLYKISAAYEQQNLSTSGKTRSEKLEGSYLSDVYGWRQTLSVSLRADQSVPIDAPRVNSFMILPDLNWAKVKSDDPLRPNRGYRLNFDVRGTTKFLFFHTDFLQAHLQGKTIIPLSDYNRLILRGDLGHTFISDVNQLPIGLQFYAGGAQSVRGYQFQELGPGRTIVVGSLEFQQKLKGDLYGAIFTDMGNVSNGIINNLKKSVGIGLVWRSPIGAFEITLAEALDNPGHPHLLQFSMGPEL